MCKNVTHTYTHARTRQRMYKYRKHDTAISRLRGCYGLDFGQKVRAKDLYLNNSRLANLFCTITTFPIIRARMFVQSPVSRAKVCRMLAEVR